MTNMLIQKVNTFIHRMIYTEREREREGGREGGREREGEREGTNGILNELKGAHQVFLVAFDFYDSI